MNLILTMAGRYTRFVNEGYKIPKYLLSWGEKSILSEIIIELNQNEDFKNVYLIANHRDELFMPHVRKILNFLNIPKENLIIINDTAGQAETAYQAIMNIKSLTSNLNGPIVFHNIDTILYNRNFQKLPAILEQNDGFIDIFHSSNHDYSYVLVENDLVKTIVEKIVISEKATSGLYGFSSADKFLEYYTDESKYISELYQKMISNNGKIAVSTLYNESDTLVLGTPSEYLAAAYTLDL